MEFHFRRHFRLWSKMKNAFRSAYTSQKGLGLEIKVLVLILVLKKVSITSLVLCYVKLWNYWRIFRKNIPLSLKMLSASGGLRPPTGPSPLDPTEGLPSPDPLFCIVQNILEIYCMVSFINFEKWIRITRNCSRHTDCGSDRSPTQTRRFFFLIRGLTQSLF